MGSELIRGDEVSWVRCPQGPKRGNAYPGALSHPARLLPIPDTTTISSTSSEFLRNQNMFTVTISVIAHLDFKTQCMRNS